MIKQAHRLRLPLLLKQWVVLGALLSVPAGATTFSRGALIIPEQANFQDACGSISAYGLVWRLLQANQKGHYFDLKGRPVTIYWSVRSAKSSPNRCIPTNTSTPPTLPADARWNDGCDISFTSPNPLTPPVIPVNYSYVLPSSGPNAGMFDLTQTIWFNDTTTLSFSFTDTVGPEGPYPFALPAYPVPNLTPANFTTVQYLGGPFVIDAPDVPDVIDFLNKGDAFVSAAQLKPFIDNTCVCPNGGANPDVTCHYVRMHQATASFDAPISHRMTQVPPTIALLDTGVGVKYTPAMGSAYRVLNRYLENAGLYYPNSVGCPPGNTWGCTLNGGSRGLIYDRLSSYEDLVSTAAYPQGLLNGKDSGGNNLYQVLWTPHWESSTNTNYETGATVSFTSPPASWGYTGGGDVRVNAFNNVAAFLDRSGTGMMAECVSIASYEGAPGAGFITAAEPSVTLASRFFFANSLNPTYAITSNPISDSSGNGYYLNFEGRNCTDPDYVTGRCAGYAQSDSLFTQVGDYHFIATEGSLNSFGPNLLGTRQPWVSRSVVSWNSYAAGDSPNTSTPSGDRGWDLISFGNKDGDPTKGTIVYLGGHEYTQSVAAHRIVLNTLLNLGSNPVGTDRALSTPIAYTDPNAATSDTKYLLFGATYSAVTGYSTDPAIRTFDKTKGSLWIFPHTPGHFRAYYLTGPNGLATGESPLTSSIYWDGQQVLAGTPAKNRNIFTYFGGRAMNKPATTPYLPAPYPPIYAAPHDAIQAGWVPETVSGGALAGACSVAVPNPGCVDVMKYSGYSSTSGPTGLVPGSDGICDLLQAANFSTLSPGTDYGGSCLSPNINRIISDAKSVQLLFQHVRGYCYPTDVTTPVLEPLDSQCAVKGARNVPDLGGVVRSTPAIVGASKVVPGGSTRPTVAYVGGWDGQLHAFYVSGGTGYAQPTSLHFPNVTANSTRPNGTKVFPNDYTAQVIAGTLAPGTELWSFVPASQLGLLQYNAAKVDASSVVMDVFVDLIGSGVREWHTILVAAIGSDGNEILALDVSNPLQPVLVWLIEGSVSTIAKTANPNLIAANVLANDPSIGTGSALKWNEANALFRLPPLSDNPASVGKAPGRASVGVFDYSNLGATAAFAMGQIRVGTEPVYAVMVTSNASNLDKGGYPVKKGLEVFAVDVASGQKLWQWEEPYSAAAAQNDPPPPASLLSNGSGVTRVYAGDSEGRVWELDGAIGVNVNSYDPPSPASHVNYAAFDTGWTTSGGSPQPISTNIAIAEVPPDASSTSALYNFRGTNVLMFGTAGSNWSGIATQGQFHLTVLNDQKKRPYANGGTALDGSTYSAGQAQSDAASKGVLQEPAGFPVVMPAATPAEKIYGAITVAGSKVFYATATGSVPTDPMKIDAAAAGKTYSIDLGLASTSAPTNLVSLPGGVLANYGGVTAFQVPGSSTVSVLGLHVSKISRLTDPSGTRAAPNPSLNANGNSVLYQMKSWLSRFLN